MTKTGTHTILSNIDVNRILEWILTKGCGDLRQEWNKNLPKFWRVSHRKNLRDAYKYIFVRKFRIFRSNQQIRFSRNGFPITAILCQISDVNLRQIILLRHFVYV